MILRISQALSHILHILYTSQKSICIVQIGLVTGSLRIFELPFVSKRCGIRTPVPLLNGHTGHHGSTSKTYGCFLGCLDCLGEIGHI